MVLKKCLNNDTLEANSQCSLYHFKYLIIKELGPYQNREMLAHHGKFKELIDRAISEVISNQYFIHFLTPVVTQRGGHHINF